MISSILCYLVHLRDALPYRVVGSMMSAERLGYTYNVRWHSVRVPIGMHIPKCTFTGGNSKILARFHACLEEKRQNFIYFSVEARKSFKSDATTRKTLIV
ncbi:hypothetical protein GOP47_0022120, partial [Adiantum capillus-veneris]